MLAEVVRDALPWGSEASTLWRL